MYIYIYKEREREIYICAPHIPPALLVLPSASRFSGLMSRCMTWVADNYLLLMLYIYIYIYIYMLMCHIIMLIDVMFISVMIIDVM